MVEDENQDGEEDDTIIETNALNELQNQLSEANLARDKQVLEITRLKTELTNKDHSHKVNMNKSGEINVRKDNFEYDEENDSIKVINPDILQMELEQQCTADVKNREAKLGQMKARVLSQVKMIERTRRGRTLSVGSVRSVNSGVRNRSESDEEDYNSRKKSKTQQKPSLLPTKSHT